jgi:Helix-turn-helix of DDE superfamily endonuclease
MREETNRISPTMEDYTWQYIQQHPRETKRLLGIDHEQLVQLIERGKIIHKIQQEKIEQKKIRIIKAGGGNHPKLSEEEQMILMLVYLRHHLSFQLLGLLFHVSESSAHKIFEYWQKLFQDDLPASLLEQVKKYPKEMERIREDLIKHELIVDSTERASHRKTFRA